MSIFPNGKRQLLSWETKEKLDPYRIFFLRYAVPILVFAVLLVAAALTYSALLPEAPQEPTDFLSNRSILLGAIAITIVVIYLGRGAMGQESGITMSDREKIKAFRLRVSFWAVLTLSAVSFSTTLFGMAEFLSPKDADEGSEAFAWLLSAGTTLGIQGLMLIMALMLGDRLINSQTLMPLKISQQVDESDEELYIGEFLQNTLRSARFWQGVIALLLAVTAYYLYLNGAVVPLFGFSNDIELGSGFSPAFILCALVALLITFKSKLLGNNRKLVSILFLAFVYFGTLAVSSLFSFNAYYRTLQSDVERKAVGEAVVRDQSERILALANAHFAEEISRVRQDFRRDQGYRDLEISIANLINKSRQYEGEIRDELTSIQNDLLAQQRKIQEVRSEEILLNSNLRKDVTEAEVRVEQLKDTIEATTRDVARLTAQLAPLQKELDDQNSLLFQLEAEMAQEKTGADGRTKGEGPKWRALNEQFASNVEMRDFMQQRLTPIQAQLDEATSSLNQARADLRIAETNLSTAQTTLATFTPEQGDMPETVIAGQGLESLRQREQAIENLDVSQVSLALATFSRDLTQETYSLYLERCGFVQNALLSVARNRSGEIDPDIQNFQCKPITFESNATNLLDLIEKKEHFEQTCIANKEVETAEGEARGVLKRAQDCLRDMPIIDKTTDGLISDLLTLEEEYGSDGYDIRQAINSFERGEKFAVGAALGSVFIDLLILVVGLIIAMLQESKLNLNPTRPTAEQIEMDLVNAAQIYGPGGDYHAGLKRFYSYFRPNRKKISTKQIVYTMEIDLSEVAENDRVLVNAMVNAAQPLIRINTDAVDDRGNFPTGDRAVYEIHRSLAMTINQLIGATTDRPETSDDFFKPESEAVANDLDQELDSIWYRPDFDEEEFNASNILDADPAEESQSNPAHEERNVAFQKGNEPSKNEAPSPSPPPNQQVERKRKGK